MTTLGAEPGRALSTDVVSLPWLLLGEKGKPRLDWVPNPARGLQDHEGGGKA
jgi:hypothetical protein